MRVITGSARGRKLVTLDGRDVRPTTDMVKEAMFSILHFELEQAMVLDLFAGSGQLGIEALSRGARCCIFVDQSVQSHNAEKILKQTMGAYISEQERIRREAEEAARRAAQAEVERRLQEAIALEAQGKTSAADAAVEEAEIMDEMSNVVSVAAEKPKAEGVTTKKDWEIESIDSSKVPVLVAGVELRPVDTSAVMRLIRSTKGQVHIPGVVYKEVAKVAFRK